MNNAITKAPAKRKSKPKSLERAKARAGYFFVLPFILGFFLLYLPILVDSLTFSFSEMQVVIGGGFKLEFVGWQNYSDALLVDPEFATTLITGIGELVFDIPAIVIFSLFVAILLNQKMIGRAAFRAIFFIPVILSTGLMASIEATNVLDEYMGSGGIDNGAGASTSNQIVNALDVQALFENMAIGQELVTYVVNIVNNIFDIVNRSGVQMLIFLSGLQGISPAIYESCSIDGASTWETFWKITLPMISPIILVNTVYTVIDSFTSSGSSVMSYISGQYNGGGGGQTLSAAMSWIYFTIVIVLVAVVSGIIGSFIFYQRRD